MDAPQTTRLMFLVLLLCATLSSARSSATTIPPEGPTSDDDGVSEQIPENNKRKIVSLEINVNKDEDTGRAKNKKLMQKLTPMFILPFVIQSTIVPLFLGLLKFMLFKSLMIGKLALVLIIINAFRNSNSFKGRRDEEIANIHYGYHGNGNEEYGSFFNN